LSLSITLIALYLAIGSYIFASIQATSNSYLFRFNMALALEIESWNYGDSVVFCVATISTIGYGNIVPVTTGGRIFCIFYAIIGTKKKKKIFLVELILLFSQESCWSATQSTRCAK